MRTGCQTVDVVFAVLSVAGATAACATHGDAATVDTLTTYYSLVDETIERAGGRVIKVMGDGVIVTFPVSRARDVIEILRLLQEVATKRWQLFDPRCRLQVKVGAGTLISGLLGPPGRERDDLYGDALNQLFKLPSDDFVLSPAMKRLVSGD